MAARFEPLATARLRLDPVTEEMARAIVAGDLSGIEAGAGWPHEDTADGLKMALAQDQPAGWLITAEGRVIGDCGTHGAADRFGCVEIGYGLAAEFRGLGYGTEAVEAITGWLLARPDIRRVRATTAPDNLASRRVLEKAHFALTAATADEAVFERDA